MTEGKAPVRLELTWPNKDKFLLIPRDDDGKPVWVEPTHPAAHEVRLTTFTGAVGEVNEADPFADNLAFRGDSLDVLRVLRDVPEYAAHYRGKVKLVYIDPPFNTGQTFTHYDDWMEHSVWLSFMRDRLLLIKDLLAPDGSVWVHLDDAEVHRMRCLMDEVFGGGNFVSTVVWEKVERPRMDAKGFSARHDSILVFSRSATFSPNGIGHTELPSYYNLTDGDGRVYTRAQLRKGGSNSRREDRPNLFYPIKAPDGTDIYPKRDDGIDGRWRWSKKKMLAEYDTLEWVQGRRGWNPYTKIFADNLSSKPPETIWLRAEMDTNTVAKKEIKALFPGVNPFDTPKPERLLERVIHIASNPGDIVLDCFGGSGTTAAVAHKMGRRWVTVELSESTLADFIAPRITKVINGEDSGGITVATEWSGGGGFRTVEVEPSLYEVMDDGLVLLREDLSGTDLARAMCGQLGFIYDADHPPFCGQQGRMRLVVIDGVVGTEEIRNLTEQLADNQRVTIAATAALHGGEDLLKDFSRGSRLLKIPRDVLERSSRRIQQRREATK